MSPGWPRCRTAGEQSCWAPGAHQISMSLLASGPLLGPWHRSMKDVLGHAVCPPALGLPGRALCPLPLASCGHDFMDPNLSEGPGHAAPHGAGAQWRRRAHGPSPAASQTLSMSPAGGPPCGALPWDPLKKWLCVRTHGAVMTRLFVSPKDAILGLFFKRVAGVWFLGKQI